VVEYPGSGYTKFYRAYSGQVRCALIVVDQLFEALKKSGHWDNAKIIVHSAHGSRINIRAPIAKSQNSLSKDDFRDAFSTFFAVRNGASESKIFNAPSNLQTILARAMGLSRVDKMPQVYLAKSGHELKPVPLQGFDEPHE
jgi:hypothetical protein